MSRRSEHNRAGWLLLGASALSWAVLGLVCLGLLAIAAADTAFAYFINEDLSIADVTGAGWFAGYLVIALAAFHPQAAAPAPAEDEDDDVPLGAVLAPLRAAGAGHGQRRLHRRQPVRGLGAGRALPPDHHRQLVTLLENRDLSRRLRRTLAEPRRQEVQLRHQAFHDFLTGLANRQLFWDRLEHALALGHRDPVSSRWSSSISMVAVADGAMYQAKAGGGGVVVTQVALAV